MKGIHSWRLLGVRTPGCRAVWRRSKVRGHRPCSRGYVSSLSPSPELRYRASLSDMTWYYATCAAQRVLCRCRNHYTPPRRRAPIHAIDIDHQKGGHRYTRSISITYDVIDLSLECAMPNSRERSHGGPQKIRGETPVIVEDVQYSDHG